MRGAAKLEWSVWEFRLTEDDRGVLTVKMKWGGLHRPHSGSLSAGSEATLAEMLGRSILGCLEVCNAKDES